MSLRMLPSTVRYAALYLVAIIAGQLTVLGKPDATPVIWPATAVAVIWLVNRTDSRSRWVDAGVLGGLTTLALVATGTDVRPALVHAGAAVLEALVFAVVATRWLPGVWVEGRPLKALAELVRVLLV